MSSLTEIKLQRDDATNLERAEIEFTNAFNAQRGTLAGFAKCGSESELHVVRDGFFLGLASELCATEYEPVKRAIVEDFRVAAAAGTAGGFQQTIESARGAEGWPTLMAAVREKAQFVGSDLESIWMTLETGRLEWLHAASCAHGLKTTLKAALDKDPMAGDVSDAKMVWIYAICLNVDDCKSAATAWASVVGIVDASSPLSGYDASAWDPRRAEWKPLDLGAQAAAERGGSSLNEAWDL
jgi:hypothetical protein